MFLHDVDVQITRWAESLQFPSNALLRILLAAICGGMIGLEREIRGRQAGFRTNLLVCMGSALVMVVSTQFATSALHIDQREGININVDPSRIAYGVMTGVGFLGAGTIVQQKGGQIRGLTSGAALWCVAAIGLSAGFGLYLLTLLSTLMVLISLWILDYVEDMIPKRRYRYLIIRRRWAVGCVAATVEYLKQHKLDVVDAAFERSDDLKDVDIKVHVAFVNKASFYNVERKLADDSLLQLIETRET